MEDNKLQNVEQNAEEKELNNDELKEVFRNHLKTTYSNGLITGMKTVCGVILSYIEESNNKPNKLTKKIKKFCENTTGITAEDFASKMNLFNEMHEVANDETRPGSDIADRIKEELGEDKDEINVDELIDNMEKETGDGHIEV